MIYIGNYEEQLVSVDYNPFHQHDYEMPYVWGVECSGCLSLTDAILFYELRHNASQAERARLYRYLSNLDRQSDFSLSSEKVLSIISSDCCDITA